MDSKTIRDAKGRIRSAAQQEASRLLFEDPTYVPHNPNTTFSFAPEWITYNNLVKRIRTTGRARA